MNLIACSFHWYSVSACDYVRLVGWMTHDESGTKARDYVKRVIPQVYLWRNKIGAHFSRSQAWTGDNEADKYLSVMNPIEYYLGSFHAGSAVLTIISNEVKSISKQGMMWSLTETHKMLASRYWPPKLEQTGSGILV